jgi:hypothetical protein
VRGAPEANSRAAVIADRGRGSPGTRDSYSGSTREAQSAAQPVKARNSSRDSSMWLKRILENPVETFRPRPVAGADVADG